MPDLMITQYSYLDKDGVEGDKNNIDNTNNVNGLIENAIKEQVLYDKEKPFEPFTIRIYFEWFEGEGEKQDDKADTVIGMNAATASVEALNNNEEPVEQVEEDETEEEKVELGKLKIKASISFKQLLASEIEEEKLENGATE